MPNLNINIEKRPMEIDNAKLQCLPTEEEVRTALTSMPAGKAPGMDRTTSEILTFYWSTIKNDVTTTILHFFGTKRMLRSLNLVILTLIPKKETPERLEDYMPTLALV